MSNEILQAILARVEALFGPIIAQALLRIIVKEAKLNLTTEQLDQLQVNRAKAQAAKADDQRRAA